MIDGKDGYIIFSFLGELITKNKIAKTIVLILTTISVVGIISIIFYSVFEQLNIERKDYLIKNILPFFIVTLILIALAKSIYFFEQSSDATDAELKNLKAERVIITQKIETEKELDIFHTIQLSLNQLNEYYTINKNQAKSSFRFSVFAIVIGLITILTGIWLQYLDIAKIEVNYITAISGLILEFIGGAYFLMYKKSLEQVNFFFGQLIKIQDTMLSINLANNIESVEKKTEMNEKIIVSLLERSLK
ncbi:TRADD-N-associated membrane domain-containing protein [Flavobacterium psychrolimnae]|uniref:Cyanobacterial TRADD-N associated 2 transmembrane domain-containing protein n=1 Tax=Flavobacterium psychrolimnae TaxID=249351 RepID=A0A366B0K5_9FLAO|nr:hypothetical protein [Flavobacterium psychrolimnae]RBN49728.1 hypothetical protein DR980_12385 [Flavobacterium psychrolimnae]